MDADLTRCCPKTLQIHYDDYGWISCPLNEGFTARQKIGGCEKPNFWEDIAWNKTRRINTSMEVRGRQLKDQHFSKHNFFSK